MQKKMYFVVNSFKEYILDMALGRVDPFVFKTAEFCKRNYYRLKHMLEHLVIELRKVKQGMI